MDMKTKYFKDSSRVLYKGTESAITILRECFPVKQSKMMISAEQKILNTALRRLNLGIM